MHYLPQQMTRALAAVGLAIGLAAALSGCVTGKPTTEAKVLVWPNPPDEPRFFYEQTLRTSADIVEETSAERLKRMATGQTVGGRSIDKPWGVAAYDGRVFVTDTIGRKIHVFDMRSKRYYDIGSEGAGALAKPLDVTTDEKGRVYVCDNSGKRIVVYDFEGKYLRSIGGKKDELHRPSSVAVSASGDRIYVVDTGGVDSDKHRVVVFDGDGNHVMDIGTRGNEPGQFNLPVSITRTPDGNIYVVDGGNFRIQAFSPDGKYVLHFGDVGRRSGQFARPKGIGSDREGNLYVTDSAFANFQIFDKKGQLLLHIGDRGNEGGGAQFMLPAGVAVDPIDGRVYVVDQFFRKVDVFRPASTPAGRQPRPGEGKDGKDAKKVS